MGEGKLGTGIAAGPFLPADPSVRSPCPILLSLTWSLALSCFPPPIPVPCRMTQGQRCPAPHPGEGGEPLELSEPGGEDARRPQPTPCEPRREGPVRARPGRSNLGCWVGCWHQPWPAYVTCLSLSYLSVKWMKGFTQSGGSHDVNPKVLSKDQLFPVLVTGFPGRGRLKGVSWRQDTAQCARGWV